MSLSHDAPEESANFPAIHLNDFQTRHQRTKLSAGPCGSLFSLPWPIVPVSCLASIERGDRARGACDGSRRCAWSRGAGK
jgi:hypothetical protein